MTAQTLDDISRRLTGNRIYSIPHMRDLISDLIKVLTPIVQQQEREAMVELGWRWEALDIVRQMENIGVADNIARTQLLRLVVSHAVPSEVKELVETMSANAHQVNELWQSLKSKIPD